MIFSKKLLISFSFILFSVYIFAIEPYNPPVGGELFPSLYAPSILGGGISVTGGSLNDTLPGSLALNPALSAGEENPIFDISYILLAGIKPEKGFGHAVNAGFIYPANWGVIGGNLNFTHVRFDSLNFGTFGEGRFSYSKDITEKLYVGLGSYFSGGTDWSLGLDLGVLYKFGDLGFLKDSKLGVSLTGIGKPYNPKINGVRGNGKMIGYPSVVTPHIGFSTYLVSIPKFKMGFQADLAAPSFLNMTFDTGLSMLIMDMVTIRTAYTFNLLETLNKKQTNIPSVGIGVRFKINPKNKDGSAKQGLEQTEISPQFAARPFYNNIWAFGIGVTTKFGTKDTEGPKIEVGNTEGVYISPNNDGIKDAMELPFRITDKRYVTSWVCEIKDENGNIIRKIENKKPIRELKSASSFFKLLGQHKGNVEVPSTLRWDGTLDSGEIAADGTYTFTVQATDDNKNFSSVGSFTVVVDNTPPSININEEESSKVKIFSPDGDGNKDSFLIVQNGSKEDLWEANIFDNHYRKIKSFKLEGANLHNFTWDGKDDKDEIVSDGVYSYVVSAKDRAGNENKKTISNIIVDTNKPNVAVNIYKKYFSPNGDGVNDTMTLNPILSTTGLVKCTLEIKNAMEDVVKSIGLSSSDVKALTFDGKKDDGSLLKEGVYFASIRGEYNNGFIAEGSSPEFILDITPPSAKVVASSKLFSPDGDGKLDSVTFTQDTSNDSWKAKIFSLNQNDQKEGDAVQIINFGNSVPKKTEWAGLSKEGVLLRDGKYAYVLEGVDEAGNKAESNMAIVELNTEKADVILQSDLLTFSPNNDGVKDFLTLLPIIRSKTKITSYRLTITSEADNMVVNTTEGDGEPPTRIVWRALTDEAKESASDLNKATYCKDGFYQATLEVELENKQTAKSTITGIEIDTTYPSVDLQTQYLVFSPNQGTNHPTLPIKQISSKEDLWQATITNERNDVVRTMKWNGEVNYFDWDACDDAGNKVANGKFVYSITATDKAGNTTTKAIKDIVVDDRVPKVYVTQEYEAFSPNNDGIKDEQTFSLHTNIEEGIAKWSFAIHTQNAGKNSKVIYLYKDSNEKLPKAIKWNGKEEEAVVEGNFIAELQIEYAKGDVVSANSSEFLSCITPPKLGVGLKPKYFSPDNDGIDDDLFINLKAITDVEIDSWTFDISEPQETGGKHFWSTGGKGKITDEIIWDGRSSKGEIVQSATDYPFTFTAKDVLGLSSTIKGYIPVDILVIRDGDKLKIAVPSIIFRPNADDFKGLEENVVDKNTYVLKRVAQILNKFTDYQVQVEGHANSTTGSEAEEKRDLIPLSTLRAKAVMQILIKNGVRSSRLSAVGMGGSRPVASLSDRDNWWKNRRVEFVLIK
ncbi:MAG: OmpA family protein [Treponema sp.]